MPSRVLAHSTCPPQGPFPPAAFFVATIRGTTPPSDSRGARLAFPIGLYEPRCLDLAAQTGLSCSVPLPARVLRPLPRRVLRRVPLRTEASQTWPSPRSDRLGSRIVNLSRLQASRHVAARVLAPSVEALDTPLGPSRSLPMPGVCYSALRRLPRRDLHPLETNSVRQTMICPPLHDAPPGHCRARRWRRLIYSATAASSRPGSPNACASGCSARPPARGCGGSCHPASGCSRCSPGRTDSTARR